MWHWIRSIYQNLSCKMFRRRTMLVHRTVKLTEDGFILREQNTHHEKRARWQNTRCIRAYKIDLISVDCICLLFEQDDYSAIEVLEEDEGFADLMAAMGNRFPGISADWYANIMLPPFERNETLLFSTADDIAST